MTSRTHSPTAPKRRPPHQMKGCKGCFPTFSLLPDGSSRSGSPEALESLFAVARCCQPACPGTRPVKAEAALAAAEAVAFAAEARHCATQAGFRIRRAVPMAAQAKADSVSDQTNIDGGGGHPPSK
mmetsp:Transcript_19996/g.46976  ORF Transcript_19996/g.46976 Transcript_19996/m.46976 type:complete len:126 (+) Transcript_19996:57-434(+)